MIGFIIDTIIRLFLLVLAVLCVGFIAVAIIFVIGEKNDWW